MTFDYFVDADFEEFCEPVTMDLGNYIVTIGEYLTSNSYAKREVRTMDNQVDTTPPMIQLFDDPPS